jgi:hypothetical protein
VTLEGAFSVDLVSAAREALLNLWIGSEMRHEV